MKIQIDTEAKESNHRRGPKHGSLYAFLGFCALIFAVLYIYGYILYTK